MEKRGQIAVFLILGIAIIVLVSFVSYTQTNLFGKKAESAIKKTAKIPTEIAPIKKYGESCLKDVSDRGLWLIGGHGGYIDPEGNEAYGEEGVHSSPSPTTYDGKNVPYYLVNTNSYALPLEEIEKKLSRYIIVEFERCFDLTAFEDSGFYITGPEINYTEIGFDFGIVDVDSEVNINWDSVTVNIKYPLKIKKRDFEAKLQDFRVELPLRLGRIYNATVNGGDPVGLLNDIENEWGDGDDEDYALGNFNCDSHDPIDKQINIYSRNNDDGDGDTKIIRVIDYMPFYSKYIKAYIFQFAIKGDNPIKFTGDMCGGT